MLGTKPISNWHSFRKAVMLMYATVLHPNTELYEYRNLRTRQEGVSNLYVCVYISVRPKT